MVLLLIGYSKYVSILVLLNVALQVALIALIVNIIATVVVEIIVEVEAVVACYAELDACACSIACYEVVDRVWVVLIVGNNLRCVERVVKLEQRIRGPLRVTNVILGSKA